MKYYLSIATFVLAFLAGPQSARAQADAQHAAAGDEKTMALHVPFDTIPSQHMVVMVKINGKGPYRMIFDTGAPFTLVNNKTAKEAGVFPKDYKKPFMLLNPFNQSGSLKLQEVEIGEMKLKNLQSQVMDHPTVAAVASIVGPIRGHRRLQFLREVPDDDRLPGQGNDICAGRLRIDHGIDRMGIRSRIELNRLPRIELNQIELN